MTAVTRFQILRGNTTQRLAFIPLRGELVVDTETNILYVGDGVTPGGKIAAPLASSVDKVIAILRNESGSTILKGTPVCIQGATISGVGLLEICRADNIGKMNSVGITESDILNNTSGIVIVDGRVGGLDTSAFNDGDDLYIAPAGGMTNVKPVEPYLIEVVAKCVFSDATSGSVIVSLSGIVNLPNLPNNHVPIGQTGGNTTTFDLISALALKYDASNPNGYETPSQLNARDTANRARANHTGTQLSSTISDFAATVRSTVLTGLSLVTSQTIAATDTILQAFGYIQAQITTLFNRTLTAGYGLIGGGNLTADRSFAVSLTNSSVAETANTTTTSLTYTLLGALTITPPAGTYLAFFGSSIVNSNNGPARTQVSFFVGGVQDLSSERYIGTSGGAVVPVALSAPPITVNGSQAIEVRWLVAGGTSTANEMSLHLTRIA